MSFRAHACRWVLGGIALAAVASGLVLLNGAYNVAATVQHTAPVYALLDHASRMSISWRARSIAVPPLSEPAMLARGAALYRRHCVACHGAPGVAPEGFALGLTPAPKNMVQVARSEPPRNVFWVTTYGLKMTGMPAWAFRLDDSDRWAVTAFVMQLPSFTPEQYATRTDALAAPDPVLSSEAPGPSPDPVRGQIALQQYACTTCHVIPGIVGANKPVGPSLERLALRRFLSGTLPNTPENLVRWLRTPASVDARTAMPDLGVSERDARDMAAYLGTLQ